MGALQIALPICGKTNAIGSSVLRCHSELMPVAATDSSPCRHAEAVFDLGSHAWQNCMTLVGHIAGSQACFQCEEWNIPS